MYLQPKHLNLVYTYSCNASCRHCCFSCSPIRTEKMDICFAKDIINDVIKFSGMTDISLSGGEVFLYLEEIFSIIRFAKIKKLNVSCNTNGYWGENRENADKIMRKLRALNISLLSISYDFFHKEFVPVNAIKNIIEFAKKYDININLKGIIFKDSPNVFQLMNDLGEEIDDIPVIASYCLQAGRAANMLDESNLVHRKLRNRRCNSLGNDITIYPDGMVCPCCSPMLKANYFGLGNLYETSLETVLGNLNINESLFRLKKYGFPKTKDEGMLSIQTLCDICRNYFEKGTG